ncbi:bifunctional protein FolD [Acrasis kona]|uniref:Bifunctional protein FolD n=1 Tax=Acrasis kona TaxID=1008807 RepID=A0AAW2ZIA2_9EUKA
MNFINRPNTRLFSINRALNARIINGKSIAREIRHEISSEFLRYKVTTPNYSTPGLAVLLVGDRKDSALYVEMKKRTASKLRFSSSVTRLKENCSMEDILSRINDFNNNPNVHGILVQLPLPSHIDPSVVLRHVDPNKDVDGLNPSGSNFQPCTPRGCIQLLERMRVTIEGKTAVVLGSSRVVGRPLSQMLADRNAHVTMCHVKSSEIKQKAQRADILVSACGVPELVRGDWVKPGAVVIDVGINHVPDKSRKGGYKVVGDVCYEEVRKVAGHITPVPGGVGPMTIASLMQNTWRSFKEHKVNKQH